MPCNSFGPPDAAASCEDCFEDPGSNRRSEIRGGRRLPGSQPAPVGCLRCCCTPIISQRQYAVQLIERAPALIRRVVGDGLAITRPSSPFPPRSGLWVDKAARFLQRLAKLSKPLEAHLAGPRLARPGTILAQLRRPPLRSPASTCPSRPPRPPPSVTPHSAIYKCNGFVKSSPKTLTGGVPV